MYRKVSTLDSTFLVTPPRLLALLLAGLALELRIACVGADLNSSALSEIYYLSSECFIKVALE